MNLRVGFVSLGCPKNLVDSEVMMGHLSRAGAELVSDASSAEVVVVNTCGFIDAAREESVDAILEAAELKRTGRCRRLVVAGCLVQRSHAELAREIPEIDAFVGLDDIPGILGIAAPELEHSEGPPGAWIPTAAPSPGYGHMEQDGRVHGKPRDAGGKPPGRATGSRRSPPDEAAGRSREPGGGAASRPSQLEGGGVLLPLHKRGEPARDPALSTGRAAPGADCGASASKRTAIAGPATWIYDHDSPRVLAGPRHSAYLKISEGCDNACSFCAIPTFRGAYRSRTLPSILAEAENLAAQGVLELNLIAQDSTHYGHDLGLDDGPARLLRALDGVSGLRWIRLFYLYPNRVTGSLLDAIAESDRVVKYLDMPLQSASRGVLMRMKRGGDAASHQRLLERMRKRIPGLVLRSTFIVGFPGESEGEFEETLAFVRDAEFDHVGVFRYSHEAQTSAFVLEDDIPAEIKDERRERILEAQEKIALRKNRSRVGRTVEVLCEGVHPESDDLLIGRHAGQAPEIDGSVILNEGVAASGAFVRATIVQAHAFDLVARIASPALREGNRNVRPG